MECANKLYVGSSKNIYIYMAVTISHFSCALVMGLQFGFFFVGLTEW